MELDKNLLKKINELWDYLHEKYNCISIFIAGSYLLPYIKNKHDIDLFVTFDTSFKLRDIRSDEYVIKIRDEIKQKYNAMLMIRYHDTINVRDTFMISYTSPYYAKNALFGTNNLIEYDVLSNKIKYIKEFYSYLDYYDSLNPDTDLYLYKRLYHIITGMYMFQNNSYDLTEEQIKNINIIHDCQDKDKILELYSEIKKWITKEMEEVADDNT